jgi:hypothetical protein
MTRFALLALLALDLGCTGEAPDSGRGDTDTDTDTDTRTDADGDGSTLGEGDCDDENPDVHPGAVDDAYDGIDADCDGWSDNDADRDGFDDIGHGGDDCDDADDTRFPGATESYDDAVDQDCDGYTNAAGATCASSFTMTFADGSATTVDGCVAWSATPTYEFDPDAPPVVASLALEFSAWADAGFQCTVSIETTTLCEPGYYVIGESSTVAWATYDCSDVGDEVEDTYSAGAGWVEISLVDTGTATGNFSGRPLWTAIAGNVEGASGAFGLSGTFSIGAEQIAMDEDDPGACAVVDGDRDGDGAVSARFGGGDCDDDDAMVSPAAAESCDDVDNDCDGTIDEADAVDAARWYADTDGDGYGDSAAPLLACDQPLDYVADDTDCDDGTRLANPGALERCDTLDNDCDGTVDEADAIDAATWYADTDRDGYGDRTSTLTACSAPAGHVATASDCDDGDASTFPGAAPNDSTTACETDADGDDYGDATAPTGGQAGSDCDDGDGGVSPAAAEVCDDGIDNNCDDQGCLSGGSLSAAVEYAGIADEDYAGLHVGPAGDVNGDGHDDLLVGSWSDDADYQAGAAYLVLGSAAPASASLSTALVYTGEYMEDYASVVGAAGDVNGDGYDDFLVGAENNDNAGEAAGAAYLVLGGATPASATLTSALAYTGEAGDHAGLSVSSAGDVDDDGYDDFLVGGPYSSVGATGGGVAFLVLGGSAPGSTDLSSALRYGAENSNDRVGASVSGAGDTDGDGYDDFVVGAFFNSDGARYAGAAYLVLGDATPASASLSSAFEYTGESGSDYAGLCVSGAGDVNGDGYHDFLVGALGNNDSATDAGAAYLVLGRVSPASASLSTAVEYRGESAGDFAGYSLSKAGDTDGDGYDDFVVGAYSNDAAAYAAGAAYLVLGTPSPASDRLAATLRYTGAGADELAGAAVGAAGDVDADGYDDFLVGAYAKSTAGSASGAAYLVLGGGL